MRDSPRERSRDVPEGVRDEPYKRSPPCKALNKLEAAMVSRGHCKRPAYTAYPHGKCGSTSPQRAPQAHKGRRSVAKRLSGAARLVFGLQRSKSGLLGSSRASTTRASATYEA